MMYVCRRLCDRVVGRGIWNGRRAPRIWRRRV